MPLPFHVNFRIIWSTKSITEILIGISLNWCIRGELTFLLYWFFQSMTMAFLFIYLDPLWLLSSVFCPIILQHACPVHMFYLHLFNFVSNCKWYYILILVSVCPLLVYKNMRQFNEDIKQLKRIPNSSLRHSKSTVTRNKSLWEKPENQLKGFRTAKDTKTTSRGVGEAETTSRKTPPPPPATHSRAESPQLSHIRHPPPGI